METPAKPSIELGKRPKVKQGEHRDLRKHTTIPLRAITDPRIKPAALRVLCQLCAYANRAGLLWVGQRRIAKDLGVTIAAINRQVVRLKNYGYLERIHRGFSGQKADTLRVIYDPEVTAEQALAVASSVEDCRSPSMRERDEYRLAFELDMVPAKPMRQRSSKPKQVLESSRLSIEEAVKGFDKVTEADMRALAVAIEAGLTAESWAKARAEHPAASVAMLVHVCSGSNEGMPANTKQSGA